MKKRIVIVGALTLLLIGCKSKDDALARQVKIAELTTQVDSVGALNDALLTDIDSLTTDIVRMRDSILNPNSETFQEMKALNDSTAPICDDGSYQLTQELLWGNEETILKALEDDFIKLECCGSILKYFSHLKSGKPTREQIEFETRASDSKEKYLFEILADVVGLHIGASGSNRLFLVNIQKLSFAQKMSLVNQVTDQIFAILDHHWKSEDDRATLIIALEYVLETTREVDYRARLIDGKTFENEEYENNWNGIQKFFYRTEQKFPGSTSQIRVRIRKHIDELVEERDAVTLNDSLPQTDEVL